MQMKMDKLGRITFSWAHTYYIPVSSHRFKSSFSSHSVENEPRRQNWKQTSRSINNMITDRK